MKTVIIIQARMGSTRLPGKVLKKIMGKPLLQYQLERLKDVRNADQIVVATSKKDSDDPIIDLCCKLGVSYYRGSENDVLQRFHDTALSFGADCIVRINADCPLISSEVVDEIIGLYKTESRNVDYVSNILYPSYPIGFHTEVFSKETIIKANLSSIDKEEREHVTPYIYRNPNIFNLRSVSINRDLSHFRLTVDYKEDFELIKNIIEAIYPNNPKFKMNDIITFLTDNPNLPEINNFILKKQTL